jgi:hypothetical protein
VALCRRIDATTADRCSDKPYSLTRPLDGIDSSAVIEDDAIP